MEKGKYNILNFKLYYIIQGIKKEFQMSYGDYLDYWMKEYFEINFKYSTAKRYKESFEVIKKELGRYRLCNLTPYILNQALLKLYQKAGTKESLRNYQKVIKSSLRDATYYFGFIKTIQQEICKSRDFYHLIQKKLRKTYLHNRRN